MNTTSEYMDKADAPLRKAFEQAEPDTTMEAVMILEPEGGRTRGASEPPEPSEFDSREEYRQAITAHRKALLAQQLGPTLRALRDRGLEVRGGRLGRLVAVKGAASALLASLDIPGVRQATLEHPAGTKPDDSQEKIIEVTSNEPWTRTGIHLKDGHRVRLEASGNVEMAGSDIECQPFFQAVPPEGRMTLLAYVPHPLLPPLSLIAKVGEDGQVFFVGRSREWTIDARAIREGELLLGVNDHLHVGSSGFWTVRVFLDEETPAVAPRMWVKTQKRIYAVDEPITIEFCDDCGNDHAFVSLATPLSNPNQWIKDCGYLRAKSGKKNYADGLDAGRYEARAYDFRDRNKPGDVVTARYAFSVQVNAEGFQLRTREIFTANEQIEVEFVDPSGGSVISWVAVAGKLDPTSKYYEYERTGSKNYGTLKFNALPVGEYQARGFSSRDRMSVYQDFSVKGVADGSL